MDNLNGQTVLFWDTTVWSGSYCQWIPNVFDVLGGEDDTELYILNAILLMQLMFQVLKTSCIMLNSTNSLPGWEGNAAFNPSHSMLSVIFNREQSEPTGFAAVNLLLYLVSGINKRIAQNDIWYIRLYIRYHCLTMLLSPVIVRWPFHYICTELEISALHTT